MRGSYTGTLLVLATSLAAGCCSARPLLSELDWSTPEAAVATFRRAFQADKAEYEFLCLSEQLTAKYGIGVFEYGLGRKRFLDENRSLVDLFLEARCDPPRSVPGASPPQVVVRLRRGDHFADFRLVNEPVMWVHFDDDGVPEVLEVPLRTLASVVRLRGPSLRVVDLPGLPYEIPSPDDVQKITLTKRWRVLDIAGWSSSLDQALGQTPSEPQ